MYLCEFFFFFSSVTKLNIFALFAKVFFSSKLLSPILKTKNYFFFIFLYISLKFEQIFIVALLKMQRCESDWLYLLYIYIELLSGGKEMAFYSISVSCPSPRWGGIWTVVPMQFPCLSFPWVWFFFLPFYFRNIPESLTLILKSRQYYFRCS